MAEREKVTIQIDVDGAEKASAKLAALQTQTNKLSGSMSSYNKQSRLLSNSQTTLQDKLKLVSDRMDGNRSKSMKLAKAFRFLMFAVIGLAIEFAVVAASLMSINAAFNIGKIVMKGYNAAMTGGAVAVAAVGAALMTAAAAQREYTAAQAAHNYKASPMFATSLNASMAAVRNLSTDVELATFGLQGLNAAFAAVSKNSAFTNKSQEVLRALRDFAAIGGAPDKSLASIGEFIGLLQKEGKVTSKVTAAAAAIGPEFEKSFKKLKKGGGSVKEIFSAILSGDMAKSAGIQGAADTMGSTLVGLFKKYKTLLVGMFSDAGMPLLSPVNEAFQKIFNTIRNGLLRIMPSIVSFAKGPLIDGLVSATEKITNFVVVLMNKFLPKSEGAFSKMSDMYYKFSNNIKQIANYLDRLRDGGSVIISMFGKPIMELFYSIGQNVEHLSELAVKNKEPILAFGDRLAGIIDALMEFAEKFKEAFVAALPTINKVLSVIEKIIRGVASIISGISKMPFGGELITGLALGGILKGRRQAQRDARWGNKGKMGRAGMVGSAMFGMMQSMSMTGIPFIGGFRKTQYDPDGQPIIGPGAMGGAANNDAARIRQNQGPISSRIQQKYPRIGTAMTGISGVLNPIASQKNAMQQWHYMNTHDYDKATDTWTKGAPKETGRKAKIEAAKAGLTGGASLAGAATGAAVSAFANSGMAPQFMQENLGAIDMGSYAAMFSPMAGLGIGGAGMLLNLARGKGARTEAGGALAGAAGGAAVGASIASFIPIPGVSTAAGAVAGALIGAAIGQYGGIKAERAVAKEAAKSLQYGHLAKVVTKMLVGDTTGARGLIGAFAVKASQFSKMDAGGQAQFLKQATESGAITGTQAERAAKYPELFAKTLTVLYKDMEAAAAGPLKNFDAVMNGLRGSTGMSTEALMDLAQKAGVNLYDPVLTLTDALAGLGKQIDLTASSIARSGTDAILSASSVLDDVIQKQKTISAYEASRSKIKAGSTKTSDFIDLFRTASQSLAMDYEGDPLTQLYAMRGAFGAGGTAFAPGGVMGGREAQYRAGPNAAIGEKYMQQQAANLATNRAGAIGQKIANAGFQLTSGAGGFQQIQSQLEAMYSSQDPKVQKQARQLEALLSGGVSLGSTGAQVANTLSSVGITMTTGQIESSTGGTLQEQLTTQQVQLQKDIVAAIGTGFDQAPTWWNQAPKWWAEDKDGLPGEPDTSSPRTKGVGDSSTSRLGRTMSRHGYFDKMLTGKRSVTSSLRNTNLGSLSSDHATGNAYDLVGQNLGQYSTMVNQSGGFAEFHGSAGGRHLHVVPGPTPSGDSSTSRVSRLSSSPSGVSDSGNSSIQINVYATERQSEKEIARRVMEEISKVQRANRERI